MKQCPKCQHVLDPNQSFVNGACEFCAEAAEENVEPICEAEDIGCDCTASGMESEWEWHPDQNAYVCNGCGEVQ